MYENRRSTPKESPNVNHTENRDDPIGKKLDLKYTEQSNWMSTYIEMFFVVGFCSRKRFEDFCTSILWSYNLIYNVRTVFTRGKRPTSIQNVWKLEKREGRMVNTYGWLKRMKDCRFRRRNKYFKGKCWNVTMANFCFLRKWLVDALTKVEQLCCVGME